MLQQVMVDKEKELWEALWQPAAEGVYPVPVISASSRSAAAAAAQPQPERKYPTLLTLFINCKVPYLRYVIYKLKITIPLICYL